MNLSHKNIYITGDTCYHRRNIVNGISDWREETRPFKTHREHDNTLIKNINSCVKKEDTLICLGNFSFGGAYYLHEFFDKLNCKDIYLVLGEFDNPKLSVIVSSAE